MGELAALNWLGLGRRQPVQALWPLQVLKGSGAPAAQQPCWQSGPLEGDHTRDLSSHAHLGQASQPDCRYLAWTASFWSRAIIAGSLPAGVGVGAGWGC